MAVMSIDGSNRTSVAVMAQLHVDVLTEGLSTGDFLVIKRIGRKTCMQCAPFTRGTSIKISCVLNLQPLVCTSSK